MRRVTCWFGVAAAGLLVAGGPALAQTAPAGVVDPNAQQQRLFDSERYYQQRRAREQRRDDRPVIEQSTSASGGGLPETGRRFELSAVQFSDSAFIKAQKLHAIAADYVGNMVSFADINTMLERINGIYAERGIVTARALVPPQTIEHGILKVRLVEGRLGKLELEGNTHVHDAFISDRLALEPDAVIDVPALRRSMLYLNRTAKLDVQASLRAGDEAGESDVILAVDEPARFSGELFVDNNGTESTGEYRGGLIGRVYAPLGRDDMFTLLAVAADGSFNGMLDYNLPVNLRGGRLGFSYARGKVDIKHGPNKALDIDGHSSQTSINYDQPVWYSRRYGLDFFARASHIESETRISGFDLSEDKIWRLDSGAQLTGFGGRYQWVLRQGISYARVKDIFADHDSYWLASGQGSFSYLLTNRLVGILRGGWQYAGESALPSSLLFQIGGVSSVRGYPESVVAAAHGLYASAEAQYRITDSIRPFVFVDYGMVDGTGISESITSVGAGLRWSINTYLSGEIAWGQALRKVVPDQNSGELHARISLSLPGT